ncbi:aldo/keto reductase [Clostridium sp. PL3]|uniref:Aldo/keto reductase n=1 Tax=Clostridium thailandense TaxID=2794346 RepID=A0A949U5G1_9CLOT|nr:aldo/keto reductase [Clostridium thailandense]MBV7276823.1 aldo/keto reductase [Clostridium thailandense]
MLYRKFGKTNEEVSLLGFGCMRLPIIDNNPAKIDEKKAMELVRNAIDRGINYIDTAYPYHGTGFDKGGESEPFVAKALKDGYREKVKIATKLPSWLIKKREDMDRFLDEQLNRLETDHIDFYLVHSLEKNTWKNLKSLGINEFLDKAIKEGKIKHAGFSFHDDIDTFKDIVDFYDWSFCQIQYNYLDENYQAGKEGLQYAASKGLGIAIMEPIKGGTLANKVPKDVLVAWDKAPIKRTPAQWALRWVMNHPEVSVVLSGMNDLDQVEDNINTASECTANSLTGEELDLVDFAKKTFKAKMKINCTSCRYCMPCPAGVDIPKNFALYNNAFLMDNLPAIKATYDFRIAQSEKPSNCVQCGKCEKHCPQSIAIREELKNLRAVFEQTT